MTHVKGSDASGTIRQIVSSPCSRFVDVTHISMCPRNTTYKICHQNFVAMLEHHVGMRVRARRFGKGSDGSVLVERQARVRCRDDTPVASVVVHCSDLTSGKCDSEGGVIATSGCRILNVGQRPIRVNDERLNGPVDNFIDGAKM
jgi:hypothetical protein